MLRPGPERLALLAQLEELLVGGAERRQLVLRSCSLLLVDERPALLVLPAVQVGLDRLLAQLLVGLLVLVLVEPGLFVELWSPWFDCLISTEVLWCRQMNTFEQICAEEA